MIETFVVERLRPEHDRQSFTSSSQPLDRYLREQAGQDMRCGFNYCYVAVPDGSSAIASYYTLAMASLSVAAVPEGIRRKLPRYAEAPVALLGRLAVDRRYSGRGVGGMLLANALRRAKTSEAAAYAMLVDAKDEAAADFYRHHGFMDLATGGAALFLPLATVPPL